MRIAFILLCLFCIKKSFAQDSSKAMILGKWYTCGWKDSLNTIKIQRFQKKVLQSDLCRNFDCTYSCWTFKEENGKRSFFMNANSGCSNAAIGFATIASELKWAFNTSSKKLIITDENGKEITFSILSLTNEELKIRSEE